MARLSSWLRDDGRRSRGQSLAEMALIAPILFLVVFGIVDAARLMQSWVTIQGAAREGARYAVTGRSDCDLASPSRYDCIVYTSEQYLQSLHNKSSIEVDMQSWAFSSGGYASVATPDSPGVQCDNVEVEVRYAYVPMTPLIGTIFGTVPLKATERLVNEPFGACGLASP